MFWWILFSFRIWVQRINDSSIRKFFFVKDSEIGKKIFYFYYYWSELKKSRDEEIAWEKIFDFEGRFEFESMN